ASSDIQDAAAFGPACPQSGTNGEVVGDEDCLTLNIWTPTLPPTQPLPVLFFIHGGGNLAGAGDSRATIGAALAQRGEAVVVTLNYRLGLLGFLALPALDAESPDRISGNYALLDQQAALQWVQANIAAFGGDPARVLLFGESGGARDTCVQIVSPLSAGLF